MVTDSALSIVATPQGIARLLYSVPFVYCVGHSRFTYCLIGAVRLMRRDRRARQYGMSELYWDGI